MRTFTSLDQYFYVLCYFDCIGDLNSETSATLYRNFLPPTHCVTTLFKMLRLNVPATL